MTAEFVMFEHRNRAFQFRRHQTTLGALNGKEHR
jgi:hypothetical protein